MLHKNLQIEKTVSHMSSSTSIDPRVQALSQENKETVIQAVNALIREREGGRAEEELIDIVERWQSDEGYTSLWAIVVLGRMQSKNAVPALLQVLDSDFDFWMEAVQESLISILKKHGESVLALIEDFLNERIEHDPFDARLFVYEPIASLRESKRAKRLLIASFERDDKWSHVIAGDLVKFGDRQVWPLLRRALERAVRAGDEMEEREFRYAYCLLEGALVPYKDDQEKPWEERWSYQLDLLGKDDGNDGEEDSVEKGQRMAEALSKNFSEDEFFKKMEKENEIRDTYPIRDFSLEAYLAIRERNSVEEDFDEALRLLGLEKKWSVEKVQRLINEVRNPSEVVKALQAEDEYQFPSDGALGMFLKKLQALWNTTPREAFQGLSPEDIVYVKSVERENAVMNANIKRLRENVLGIESAVNTMVRVGRNDPCPCGSGKKYKKCCGK